MPRKSSREKIGRWISAVPPGRRRWAAACSRCGCPQTRRFRAPKQGNCLPVQLSLIGSIESWGGFKHGYGNAAIRRYATERVAGLKKGCKQLVFFLAREWRGVEDRVLARGQQRGREILKSENQASNGSGSVLLARCGQSRAVFLGGPDARQKPER